MTCFKGENDIFNLKVKQIDIHTASIVVCIFN